MIPLEERIKIARTGVNLSQEELANRLGITSRTLQRHEKCADKVTIKLAQSIAQICKVDITWLLTGITREHDNIDSNTVDGEKIVAIDADHINVIKGFSDKEAAKEINEKLVDIERVSKKLFRKAIYKIEDLWESAMLIAEEHGLPPHKNKKTLKNGTDHP